MAEAERRIQLIADPEWKARVDRFRGRLPGVPNRSEAIRLIVDAYLDGGVVEGDPRWQGGGLPKRREPFDVS